MDKKRWELEILEVRWPGRIVKNGPGEGTQESHGDLVSGFRGVFVTEAFVVCQRLEEAGRFSVLCGNVVVEEKTVRYSSVALDLYGRCRVRAGRVVLLKLLESAFSHGGCLQQRSPTGGL